MELIGDDNNAWQVRAIVNLMKFELSFILETLLRFVDSLPRGIFHQDGCEVAVLTSLLLRHHLSWIFLRIALLSLVLYKKLARECSPKF